MSNDVVLARCDAQLTVDRAYLDREFEAAVQDQSAVREATAKFDAYIALSAGLSPEQSLRRLHDAPDLQRQIILERDKNRDADQKLYSKQMNPRGGRKPTRRWGPSITVPRTRTVDNLPKDVDKSKLVFNEADAVWNYKPCLTINGLVVVWLRDILRRGPVGMSSAWRLIKDKFLQEVDLSLVLPKDSVPDRKQKLVIPIDGDQETFTYSSFERCYREAQRPEKTLEQLCQE